SLSARRSGLVAPRCVDRTGGEASVPVHLVCESDTAVEGGGRSAVVAIDQGRPHLLAFSFPAPAREHRLGDTTVTVRKPRRQVENHLILAGVVAEDADSVTIEPTQLVTAQGPLRLPSLYLL